MDMLTSPHYCQSVRIHHDHDGSVSPFSLASSLPIDFDSALSTSSRPSSSTSTLYGLYPLESLYFCDACDAIRCPDCVIEEVAVWYCPSCLFEVPGASVRGEKARCARSCFACPSCTTTLTVVASTPQSASTPGSYLLECTACRWNSESVGWRFDKATGLGTQILEREKTSPAALELDRLQTHFDRHLQNLSAAFSEASMKGRRSSHGLKSKRRPGTSSVFQPSRNISAASAAALSRASQAYDNAMQPDHRHVSASSHHAAPNLKPKKVHLLPEPTNEDLKPHVTRRNTKDIAAQAGRDEEAMIERLRVFNGSNIEGGLPGLTQMWEGSWLTKGIPEALTPQRVPLISKLIKRCCECNHTLIRPDPRATSVKYKIKIIASDYLPVLEVGNRRRLKGVDSSAQPSPRPANEDIHKTLTLVNSLLSVRDIEEAEALSSPLAAGSTYAFQIAFTNPLMDPVQIAIKAIPIIDESALTIIFPQEEFDVAGFTEPWSAMESADAGSSAVSALDNKRSGGKGRSSLVGIHNRIGGIVKRGNVTKIGFLAMLGDNACGELPFDLQVDFTYQAEEEADEAAKAGGKEVEEVLKTFTYFSRVTLGTASPARMA